MVVIGVFEVIVITKKKKKYGTDRKKIMKKSVRHLHLAKLIYRRF